LAKALGEREIVKLLAETLEEEKQTDIKLSEVTERHIMTAAMAGGDEADEAGRGKEKPRQSRVA
jgi:ferritin-like metal-binding protein YciE